MSSRSVPLMGRSAFVLLYLAWRYRVGPLLTVDPG